MQYVYFYRNSRGLPQLVSQQCYLGKDNLQATWAIPRLPIVQLAIVAFSAAPQAAEKGRENEVLNCFRRCLT